MALGRGGGQKLDRVGVVARDPGSGIIGEADQVLGARLAAVGGAVDPLGARLQVFGNATAIPVGQAGFKGRRVVA